VLNVTFEVEFVTYTFPVGDTVELSGGHRTCDSQVAGLSPGRVLLYSGLKQATYNCMPLSVDSIIWYWQRYGDA